MLDREFHCECKMRFQIVRITVMTTDVVNGGPLKGNAISISVSTFNGGFLPNQ